ncbi:hypothetical protein ZIOFF_050387 [Zingiber officinale]|uniref:X8 domain-containing protein n=1 Tax=Zingiber officinale TaxID=94328 RepID=A0A8J5G0G4_ZINOF|nr:hypothetical protein ZIOFF_050387 [Zingiber officinale]
MPTMEGKARVSTLYGDRCGEIARKNSCVRARRLWLDGEENRRRLGDKRLGEGGEAASQSEARGKEVGWCSRGEGWGMMFGAVWCVCVWGGGGARAQATLAARSWCLSVPGTTTKKLLENINYACGSVLADCRAIQEDCPCYSTDVIKMANYAMNAYYYGAGHEEINCYFNASGLIVYSDPSYEDCIYP